MQSRLHLDSRASDHKMPRAARSASIAKGASQRKSSAHAGFADERPVGHCCSRLSPPHLEPPPPPAAAAITQNPAAREADDLAGDECHDGLVGVQSLAADVDVALVGARALVLFELDVIVVDDVAAAIAEVADVLHSVF